MKKVSEFKRVQNLFVRFRRFRTKILNDPTVSFICFIGCNEFLSKRIVHLNFKTYKKDVFQFFVYCLVLNRI